VTGIVDEHVEPAQRRDGIGEQPVDVGKFRHVGRRLRDRGQLGAGGGSIINMSSVAGRLGFARRTPYAAAKWAVVGFTKSLAIEAGPDKVRVNCIQPGSVEGDRIERVIDAKAKALGIGNDEMRDRLLEGISLGTFVSAQDIANMALFLATDAGKHITGQALSVCGDVRYAV